jgi:hypothetical protein
MLRPPFTAPALLIQIFIERRLRRHFARIVDDAALMSRGRSMVRILSRILIMALAAGLTALLAMYSVRSLGRGDVLPPEPVKLIEMPMIRPVVPSGWIWFDQAEGFSVYGPPGSSHHRDDGIDWAGGHFDAPEFSWGYYIGFAPQPLHAADDPKFEEEAVVIDSRTGIIQRFTYPVDRVKDGRRYYSRLLLSNAFARYDYGSTNHALDLFGRAASREARADMEQMWRSIRFDLREVRDLSPAHGGL